MTETAMSSAPAPQAGLSRERAARYTWRVSLYLVALAVGLIFAYPLFWSLSSSLKTASEMFTFPPTVFPKAPQWANYARVMTAVPFARWFMNTVQVVVLATTGTVISATLVAYSFARFKYRGRDVLFIVTLVTMMLPAQVTLIPQFILFYKLGWIDTIKPLWVPEWFGGGAFSIFLMRQFLMSLPIEMDEAALIDGASRFRILWMILVPLAKPALATLSIISFMSHWSNFMGPLIYLNTPSKFTLAVGLRYFNTVGSTDAYEPMYHLLMAVCVLTILPCLIVFFAAQRLFVRGIVMTGIKG